MSMASRVSAIPSYSAAPVRNHGGGGASRVAVADKIKPKLRFGGMAIHVLSKGRMPPSGPSHRGNHAPFKFSDYNDLQEEEASLLEIVKKPAKEAVDADVKIYVKEKSDDKISHMDFIFHGITAQSKVHGDGAPTIGYISTEAAQGKFLQAWTEKLKKTNFHLWDVAKRLDSLFDAKTNEEIALIKYASCLTANIVKYFVVPKLWTVINEKKKVSHSTLAGVRYRYYCSSIARTFLIVPKPLRVKAYEVLQKAHEAAIYSLKPGNLMRCAYKAAISVVENELPFLVSNLAKCAGSSIGIDYIGCSESSLHFEDRNQNIVREGMVFEVSVSSKALKDVLVSLNKNEKAKKLNMKAGAESEKEAVHPPRKKQRELEGLSLTETLATQQLQAAQQEAPMSNRNLLPATGAKHAHAKRAAASSGISATYACYKGMFNIPAEDLPYLETGLEHYPQTVAPTSILLVPAHLLHSLPSIFFFHILLFPHSPSLSHPPESALLRRVFSATGILPCVKG
ncbi:hypothetical protein L6164_017410 [Bauhinia variegata]|uniref:Uncharacterized protein n=1 Tax=Bauhinia variegata TaxID=167791 RepID=A0ACB9NBC4_BAUVA|nr:hypothetical protein L6164_017410 [Bauhinia variegata]